MYYVVCSILEKFGDDLAAFYQRRKNAPTDKDSQKAFTVRELLIEEFFLPFLTLYLRDSKCEAYTFMPNE